MAMKKAPLSRVNDEFGGKGKLVDQIVSVVERGDEDKDSLRKRLAAASNSKLLRLLRVAQGVKELGGRDKLVEAILAQHKSGKDKDFRARLLAYTPARLLDLYHSSERALKAPPPPAPKPAGKKKGQAA